MRTLVFVLAAFIAPATALGPAFGPSVAHACGGCFSPPDAVTTVTDHRMVIAISNQQTTLWDQIQYMGSPKDFVWVLPTPVVAMVELAEEQFFDDLDALTRPQVFAPPMAVPTGGDSGFGCGGASAGAAAPRAAGADDVTVYHQGQVGPYETATIGSDNPDALTAWLNDHGYSVPDAMKPTIAWYVTKKWVFNALRLKPDANTSQMRPVRVRFPGLASAFPLRMVAAGASQKLGILLWVIADQRYAAMNYDTVTLDESKLRWSSVSNKSNYRAVFEQAIADHKGRAFVTEYAQPYLANRPSEDSNVAGVGQPSSITLTRLRTSVSPSLLTDDLLLVPNNVNTNVSNQHFLTNAQLITTPVGASLGGPLLPMLAVVLALGCLARRTRRRTEGC